MSQGTLAKIFIWTVVVTMLIGTVLAGAGSIIGY